jgi:TolB-like protein/tetratricopeptide (TPR) repeat protein
MKRCPECRRDYYDDSLSFCLDDGERLLDGPSLDEPGTALFHSPDLPSESPTRAQIHATDQTAILPTGANLPQASKTTLAGAKVTIPVVLIFVLAVGGFFGYRYLGSGKQIASIAVMPFVNESGDPDLEYLSDGTTETLISKLSKIPNLNVKARTSVFRYKGKEADPREVGKDLGVQAILNGRVIERGDQLTVTVELIDTLTENVIWSEQYLRKPSDLLSLQTDIARDVSGRLRNKLTGTDEKNLAQNYTADPLAYDLYLKGRYHWNRRTVDDDRTSLEYFKKAVAVDSNFALAYVGISDATLMLGIPDAMSGAVAPGEILPAARAAAERAIELDPMVAEAYASRGHVRWKQRDWAGAETDFRRSIELNPNYSYARLFYSLFLTFNGRTEEGLNESKRSAELDPYSIPINANLAMVYSLAGRPDDAIATGRRAVEFDSAIPIAHQRLGVAYEQKGMFPEAIAEFQTAVGQSNRVPLAVASLAHAYALSGKRDEAKKLLAELEAKSKDQFVSPYLLAIIHVGFGENQRALELLEEANRVNSLDLLQVKVEPRLNPLHEEPRFKELVNKIGFP